MHKLGHKATPRHVATGTLSCRAGEQEGGQEGREEEWRGRGGARGGAHRRHQRVAHAQPGGQHHARLRAGSTAALLRRISVLRASPILPQACPVPPSNAQGEGQCPRGMRGASRGKALLACLSFLPSPHQSGAPTLKRRHPAARNWPKSTHPLNHSCPFRRPSPAAASTIPHTYAAATCTPATHVCRRTMHTHPPGSRRRSRGSRAACARRRPPCACAVA